MEKRQLGKTGLSVSKAGFGVLTIGYSQLNLPLLEGGKIVRHALERGINFLDTAQYYKTYDYIREALKGTNYEPVIASKCLDLSYEEMKAAIEEARVKMDRDVIEVFLLHEVREGDDFLNREGAWEYLNEAKAKGLVKAIGVSTHHVDVTMKMADIKECDVVFPLINIKSLGIRKGKSEGTKEEMEEAISRCISKDKGVFLMKAFGGGHLTFTYQEALNYAFGIPGISSVMIGFGSEKEVDHIFDYMEKRMEKDFNPDVSGKRVFIDQGDCEGCGACVLRCPNHAIYFNEAGLAEVDSEKCLTCGYCAPVCKVRAIIMIGS